MTEENTTLAPAYPGQASQDACITKAKPGEPQFTLLGRDPVAASLVQLWAHARLNYADKAIDGARFDDAIEINAAMLDWCRTKTPHNPVDVLELVPFPMLLAALQRRGYKAVGISNEAEAHPVHAAIAAMNPGVPLA